MDEIVEHVIGAIRKETWLIALTWVHQYRAEVPASGIASALNEVNADRDEEDHVLFGLDAVHGFGVEEPRFQRVWLRFLYGGPPQLAFWAARYR